MQQDPEEYGLDPEDWAALRRLAHRMIDDVLDSLEGISQQPVWKAPSAESKAALQAPLPHQGQAAEAVYAEFLRHIFPYPKGNIHPRYWAWVQGGGTPLTVLAELLAAGMNPNVAIGDHAAMYVEEQVLAWCKELMGFAPQSGALLTGGATMANLTALNVARHSKHPGDVRSRGQCPGMVLYASEQAHNCIDKSIEIMGLGSRALRKIPTDEQGALQIQALKERIDQDRSQGLLPFCVVATVGTVNTGAIDPLPELAQLCSDQGLWLHVDGAFGAWAKSLPEYAPRLQAIEQADSLAFDLHKWGWLPYDIGCVLVRDRRLHRAAFAAPAAYLMQHERGLAAGPEPQGNFGIELSRGFRALKAWFLFKEQGTERLLGMVRQNIEQARYLGRLVEEQPELELCAPIPLNVVCFRYRPTHCPPEMPELNALNQYILTELQVQGIAAPSYTLLQGRYVLRVAHVNHRSRRSDFRALIQAVLDLGRAATSDYLRL